MLIAAEQQAGPCCHAEAGPMDIPMQPSMIINAPCQKNERSVSWADPIILS
jgi:hypothetical protein